MKPPLPKIQQTNRNALADKLLQGQETARELQILLRKPIVEGNFEAANAHAETIKLLFMDSLSMLNAGDAATANNPLSCLECSDGFAVKNSDGIAKASAATAAKDRRRGHKRRRSSDTWAKVTDAPFTDGHCWRKYGQKDILGSKFPRSYFRCTHRHDQGCQAIKQVQQMADDPSNYLITYMGPHTCKDTSKTPQLILDPTYKPFSVISFESSAIGKHENAFPTPSSAVKQELMPEEIIGDFPQSLSSPSSSSEYLLPEEFLSFDSAPISIPGSSTGSGHLGMDIKVESNEFDELIFDMF